MKYFGRLTANVALCGLAMVALSWAATARAEQGSAKVQAIRSGSAQYTVDGVSWSPLQAGTVLKPGTTLKTDMMGVVDLYLGKNGPWVRLTPDTTLALSNLMVDEGAGETVVNTQLGLNTGRIQGVVRKLSQSSRYEVKTPTGTCGIRGTRYEISASNRVIVDEGVVDVLYTAPGQATPTRFEVRAGFMFEPMLNNGAGGVIPIPQDIRSQLNSDLNSLRGGGGPEERVEVWLPNPGWNIPNRPFDSPGSEDPPFVLPPVYNPTTPSTPQGN